MDKPKNRFLWEFHYFRALAILAIVVGHVWVNPKTIKALDKTDWVGIFRETFLDGATIYFILISGFLFQHLSSTFKPLSYYGKKLRFIILPYVFMILAFHAFHAFAGNERETFSWFLELIPTKLLYGIGPLWYIPFISILFFLTPLFYYVPNKVKVRFLPYLLLIPLLGTRTGTDITLGQYIYFTPIYLFGMYASLKYKTVITLAGDYLNIILFTATVLTLVIFGFRISDYYIVFEQPYLGILYARNMLAALCAIYYLSLGKEHYKPMLDKIAIYSFALYFTHDFLHKKITSKLLDWVSAYMGELTMVFISILYVPVFIAFNFLLLYIGKKIIGKYSRYILGV